MQISRDARLSGDPFTERAFKKKAKQLVDRSFSKNLR